MAYVSPPQSYPGPSLREVRVRTQGRNLESVSRSQDRIHVSSFFCSSQDVLSRDATTPSGLMLGAQHEDPGTSKSAEKPEMVSTQVYPLRGVDIKPVLPPQRHGMEVIKQPGDLCYLSGKAISNVGNQDQRWLIAQCPLCCL